MAIDKALYQAPVGIEEAAAMEAPIEIEIEDPESVTIGMDGLEIQIEPDEESEDDFNANLAEYLDEGALTELCGDLVGDFDADISARKDWIQTYVDGLELLGLKIEERAEPWEGACGVYHPMLSEALVKFQAETMMSIFPAAGPVKTLVIGKETPEKKDSAERVREDMNYQLTEMMPEYRPETERMLWGLGLAGNAFKKVYYDPNLERQVAMFVPAEDMVVPYGANTLRFDFRFNDYFNSWFFNVLNEATGAIIFSGLALTLGRDAFFGLGVKYGTLTLTDVEPDNANPILLKADFGARLKLVRDING